MSEQDPLISSANLPFVESLYASYLDNPASVPDDWRSYFARIVDGDMERRPALRPSFKPAGLFGAGAALERQDVIDEIRLSTLQDKVDQLIRAYRNRGHMIAQIDPLGLPRPCPPELEPGFYGLTEEDMERRFSCETVFEHGTLTLRELIERLRNTYCRSIGVEYMHIDDLAVRRWLQARMERTENRLQITRKEQLRILTRLTDAATFEEFIRKKFVGAKSFSLEGSESLIPLLDLAIEKAGDQGIQEIVLAMAHRGRLNVLANIMGKSPRDIFREFADADPELYVGRGDVKYHKGYSSDWKTSTGRKIHLSLCFNPSHLEFVNPVACGRLRAKQDRVGDFDRTRGMTLLIHGDAGFAGQGVSQETLNLSQLAAYTVGGSLHIIVNNQIGFTTGPAEGRSPAYATEVFKMLQGPIFHVNGEDPEAVAQVVRLAMDFRQQFKRDIVIDMYGYRRLGHNEADEPSFTQPLLYKAIEKRKSVREGYLDHLLQLNDVTFKDADRIDQKRHEAFEKALSESKSSAAKPKKEHRHGLWLKYTGGPDGETPEVNTGVDAKKLARLLQRQTELPADFHPHPKIERLLAQRQKMAAGELPLDWSAAEALAFASLAVEGHPVRLTGQDSGRGTFSHRHAILHDYENGARYSPLQHLEPKQAPVEIYNSPLSEIAVLGFEYGYSLEYPDRLVLWEAQFGDFCNVAQVIVDQFIASAEDKWERLSGLVLLLPHGFEGQGPEHSSARLERFLQMAAEDNMQIVYPTTPAQFFHCLRRQILRPLRKPLIVMTPKSLLRHPQVVSSLEECASGSFQRILPDAKGITGAAATRVLLCSGKIYYELAEEREKLGRTDIAILRFEQLYPLRDQIIEEALASYLPQTEVCWVQEEPENMGAWPYLRARFCDRLIGKFPLRGIYRPASASPATGSFNSHKQEQRLLITAAFQGAVIT